MQASLYDTITPINSFRVVLSKLFGARLPCVSDRSFYSTAGHPLAFSEVTDLLNRSGLPTMRQSGVKLNSSQ